VEATYLERDSMYIGNGRVPWNADETNSATIDGKRVIKLIEYVQDDMWAACVKP